MKDSKVQLATVIIDKLSDTYRNKKRELSKAETALYENSLVLAIRVLVPRDQQNAVLKSYHDELASERARAEAARAARIKKDEGQVLQPATAGGSQ